VNHGRTRAAEVLLGSSVIRGREGWGITTSGFRSWRGTGRALIDLARKLLGITCHTLKPGEFAGTSRISFWRKLRCEKDFRH